MHMSDNNPCANYSSVWSPRAQQDALAASASFVKITNIDRKHRVEVSQNTTDKNNIILNTIQDSVNDMLIKLSCLMSSTTSY